MPVPILKTTIIGKRPLWCIAINKQVCGLILLTFLALSCFSQTIGNWTFNNTLTGTGGTYNTVSNADFSGAIPTKVFHGSVEYYGENGWPSGAINTSSYLEFSISPNAGYQLDLSSVIVRIRRSTTGASGSGPTSWSLRSSIDGYAADLSINSLTSSASNYTVTLGSGFLNVYTTVTFRLYGYNVNISGGGGLNRLVLDNISIQGASQVLPLTLTGIQALRGNDKNIAVKWQVNNVHEGSVFNVERSVNGTDFTTINRFTERASKAAGSYSYEDNQSPGDAQVVFYRIKVNEPTGWTYFSWLVKVNNKAIKQGLIHYASIEGQSLLTSLQVPEKGSYSVSVLSMNGAVLQKRTLDLETGVHTVALPLNAVSHGTYVVRLTGNSLLSSKQFVW
ncbi:T9SS type A sorting domain-containing protein [Niastella caeni]|uniref:T9SS type A sorting domain-containing protein n=1 Tax=Niastella caeni TaxID=2569763 RepID=A0A4V6T3P9_9BACT|nr:T9SS type A sorting domain-containing protein [Niastella caeni]THU35876.1 T9SS type A sorting domain-containing protein [Niastella caeni]